MEIENLKPFSTTHFWILFIQSCIVRPKCLRCLPSMQTAKSSTNKDALALLDADFIKLFIFRFNNSIGERMLPCGTPLTWHCTQSCFHGQLFNGPTLSQRQPSQIQYESRPLPCTDPATCTMNW